MKLSALNVSPLSSRSSIVAREGTESLVSQFEKLAEYNPINPNLRNSFEAEQKRFKEASVSGNMRFRQATLVSAKKTVERDQELNQLLEGLKSSDPKIKKEAMDKLRKHYFAFPDQSQSTVPGDAQFALILRNTFPWEYNKFSQEENQRKILNTYKSLMPKR